MKTVVQEIAAALGARENCKRAGNTEWLDRWQDRIDDLVRLLPSGSGFDNGTKLDGTSKPDRLVFNTSFHHMNDAGMYDGWTDHQVIATPSFIGGFNLRITGRNRRDIKDHITECFHSALSTNAPGLKV